MATDRAGCCGASRSIVTLQGEVFKADGEMVGSSRPPSHLRPYLLTCQLAPVGSGGTQTAAADVRATLERQCVELEPQLQVELERKRAAAQHAAVATAAAAAAAADLQQARAAVAAAERALQRLHDRQSRLQRRGCSLPGEISAAEQGSAAVAGALAAALAGRSDAQQRHAAADADYAAAVGTTRGGPELLAAESELQVLRCRAAAAQATAAGLEARLGRARRARLRAQGAQIAAEAAAVEAQALEGQLKHREEEADAAAAAALELEEGSVAARAAVARLERERKAAIG